MNDVETYLTTIFDGQEGLVYSPVKELSGHFEQYWFEYPQQTAKLVEHIENNSSLGEVYLSPVLYKERRATKDNVKKSQVVWVEFDGKEQIDFKGIDEPTLIVQTSSKEHVHCYWRIPASNPTAVEETNRRLTYFLEADTSGHDITQLLRPPGTYNHKYENPIPVALVHQAKISYTLSAFDKVPKVSIASSAVVTTDSLLNVDKVLVEHELPAKLIRMIRNETPVWPYRSSFIVRLAAELAEEELSHIEIVSLLKVADDRVGKYAQRSDQMVRLSQIADYAIYKAIAQDQIAVQTFEEILNRTETLDWIFPGWLHSTGQMILSSAPGVGKTQFISQMATCLQNHTRFLGMLAPTPHRCMIISLEMDYISFKYILNHQKKEWDKVPDVKFMDEAGSFAQYENLIAEHEPTVIFIDSLTELFDDAVDNPKSEARRVMKWCRKIRRRYGVAVVLIHHNRKATDGNKKPKTLNDLEGSFLFAKDSETVLMLWEEERKPGIELSAAKARFGRKEAFMIDRNDNLWFTRRDSASNFTRPTEDRERNQSKPRDSDRHGDEHNGFDAGKISFRFGDKDS
jgi:hypothetical protein